MRWLAPLLAVLCAAGCGGGTEAPRLLTETVGSGPQTATINVVAGVRRALRRIDEDPARIPAAAADLEHARGRGGEVGDDERLEVHVVAQDGIPEVVPSSV